MKRAFFSILIVVFLSILFSSFYVSAQWYEDYTALLDLDDDDEPDYLNIDTYASDMEDAYELYRGNLSVTDDRTPQAVVEVYPEIFIIEVPSEDEDDHSYCIKTLVLDSETCEQVAGSMDREQEEYFFVTSQERSLQFGSDHTYTAAIEAFSRCTLEAERVEQEQELEVAVRANEYTLLATKPAYSCSQYSTQEVCDAIPPVGDDDPCSWNSGDNTCVFNNYDDFTAETQEKFWFLDREYCNLIDVDFIGNNRTWDILNDGVYCALIEHYHFDDEMSSEAPIPGTFYHIEHFYSSDIIFATFFEKWAKYYIKEWGGMDESERMYCYKTNLSGTPYCFEFAYPTYAFTDRNELLEIDRFFLADVNWWNKQQYINERPAEEVIEYLSPAGEIVDDSTLGPVEDFEPIWNEIGAQIFTVTPELLDRPDEPGEAVWTRTDDNVSFYAFESYDRRDSCEYSCVNEDTKEHTPICEAGLDYCFPYDPMDDDENQDEHCDEDGEVYELCEGFQECAPQRGEDDECEGGIDTICSFCYNFGSSFSPDVGSPPRDCWGTRSEDEECKVISQHHIMRDEPPSECEDAGFEDGGFEEVQLVWYTREWGAYGRAGAWRPTRDCEGCEEGAKLDADEEKRQAPGPECETKYILDGGLIATTSFTIPDSEMEGVSEEPTGLTISKIAENIWEVTHIIEERDDGNVYVVKFIDTGNMPFEITCAYITKTDDTYEITRYFKTSPEGKWLRFIVDTDISFEFMFLDSADELTIEATHNYRTGLREDRFYTACDRFDCEDSWCEDCGQCEEDCFGICDWIVAIPTYRFCLADSVTKDYDDDICGGVSERVWVQCLCVCFPYPFNQFYCIRTCKSQWREEIESSYQEQESEVTYTYTIENVEKQDWTYGDGSSHPIEHELVVDVTRYVEGDVITTNGFINFTISPDVFRSMIVGVANSQVDYFKIYSPVKHELFRKKSSPGPDDLTYILDDKYGYDTEEYGFPEQCRRLCPSPPVCNCAPEDIMSPLCMNETPLYDLALANPLCEYFYPEMDAGECTSNLINNEREVRTHCSMYLDEIELWDCEVIHDRVYCFNEFTDDELYMGCYGDYLSERDNCVCAPNDEFPNPCTSRRNFHEEEGSIIVNGDFEMGMEPDEVDKLGPWERSEGSATVEWHGRNGYAANMNSGDSILQEIPPGAHHLFLETTERNMLCLEYQIQTEGDGSISVTISSGDETQSFSFSLEGCDTEWYLECSEVTIDNITQVEITVDEGTFLIDNVNLGKYYDFVRFYNYNLSELRAMDFDFRETTGGLGNLVVTDTKTGKSGDRHYYTIYFKSEAPPFRHTFSGEELYDVIPRDILREGKVNISTFFREYEITIRDADELKIRDAVMLSYTVDPPSYAMFPGTRLTYSLNLYNVDEDMGDAGKQVYVWCDGFPDLSVLTPEGLSGDEDDGFYVTTDGEGNAEFTIEVCPSGELNFRHMGDPDPSGPSLQTRHRYTVVSINTTLLSPDILILILILVVAVFSYRFLIGGRMDFQSWLEDFKGRR